MENVISYLIVSFCDVDHSDLNTEQEGEGSG